jgi:NAD(P) transhydrogenase subunit alpha
MSNEQIQTLPTTEEDAPATLLYETQERLDALSAEMMANISRGSETIANVAASDGHSGFLVMGLTIFVLACFVGYYVVWKVTPALHSPLMGITNAISSVIIVGAILAAGPADGGVAKLLGFLGITLASVNIFGGFIITRRMLSMFKKKGA